VTLRTTRVLSVIVVIATAPAFAQGQRPLSYGAEIAFRSGHADRGFLINDRPVIQPVTWLSASGTDFSVWSSLPVAQTSDGSRPGILEIEVAHRREWGPVTIGPSVRTYFYRDPLSPFSTRSIEGWLYLAYDAGPFRLFTNHSLDVLTYKGAYSVDAGLEAAGHVSALVEMSGSVSVGFGSAAFNEAWVGVARTALDRFGATASLTAHLDQHLYIGPHIEFSTILDRRVRTAAWRPTYVLFGLTVGGEF